VSQRHNHESTGTYRWNELPRCAGDVYGGIERSAFLGSVTFRLLIHNERTLGCDSKRGLGGSGATRCRRRGAKFAGIDQADDQADGRLLREKTSSKVGFGVGNGE
jgi:hypothetical protein